MDNMESDQIQSLNVDSLQQLTREAENHQMISEAGKELLLSKTNTPPPSLTSTAPLDENYVPEQITMVKQIVLHG